MPDQTLGQKIRTFRERAGMSQFKLELELGMSPGSLSRIENNQVNPTKETIVSFASFLKLNAVETAKLFNIDLASEVNSIRKSEVYAEKNLRALFSELLTERVIEVLISDLLNQIQAKMNYIGTSFSIVDSDSETIQLKYFSDSFTVRFSKSFIFKKDSFDKLPCSLFQNL